MSPLPKCILKVYESEVVAALGNSCLSLIQGVEKHMASAARPAGGVGAGAAASQQLEWLMPLLLVLFLVGGWVWVGLGRMQVACRASVP